MPLDSKAQHISDMSVVAANQSAPIPVKERLIVALDLPDVPEAKAVVKQLGDAVSFYKIGLGLHYIGGIDLAKALKDQGKKVFFDSKIYDIGATTKAAVQATAALGVDFLTIHGSESVLKQAVEGKNGSNIKLFVITALTSLDDRDLKEMGYSVDIKKMVQYMTEAAVKTGCDGVITSGLEAKMVRDIALKSGKGLIIVTPGIRSSGVGADDQKRVSTPEAAIAAGADYIVMGRQILRAADRVGEAKKIIETIESSTPR